MKNSVAPQLHDKQNQLKQYPHKPTTKAMNFGKLIKYKAQLNGQQSPVLKQSLIFGTANRESQTPEHSLPTPFKLEKFQSLNQDLSSFKIKSVRFEDGHTGGRFSQDSFLSSTNSRGHNKKPSILKKAPSIDRTSVLSGTSDFGQIYSLNAKSSLKDKGSACSKDKYVNQLKILKRQNTKFFDTIFPPGGSSLCYSKQRIQQFKNVKWSRIEDVFKGKKLVVFSQHSYAKCIYNSGPFNYCLPMAIACNAVANSNRCLQRIFQQQKYIGLCIYYLRLNHDGIWKYVIVDDFIPTVKEGEHEVPAFLRICENELGEVQIWPLLVQKALAKIYNSYEALFDDPLDNILYDLTGFPAESIDLHNQEEEYQFQTAVKYSQTVSIVTAPFNKHFFSDNQYPIRQQGGTTSSVYFNIDHKMKLMNLQKYTNLLIDVGDLKKQFQKALICKINDTYYSLGCIIKQNRGSLSIRKFVVNEKGLNCMLSLVQKDKKYYHNNGYDYVWSRMIVAIKDGNHGYRWIAGKYLKTKVLSLSLNLDPGEYYVLVSGDWQARVFEMNLNYQGNQLIQFQRQTFEQHPNILTEVCIDIAQRFGQFKQINKNLCAYRAIDLNNGFIIQNINNQVNRFIVFHKQYKLRGKNYQLIDKQKFLQDEQNSVQMRISPNSHFTFIAKLINGIDGVMLSEFSFD